MARSAARTVATLGLLALLLAAVAGGTYVWAAAAFNKPGPLEAPRTVVVARGSGVAAIADQLVAAGVVADALIFRLGVRWAGRGRDLRAGEFAFEAATSAREAMDVLIAGKTVARQFTIAEGLTSAEVLARVAVAEGLVGDMPPAPPDGSLLPETYNYSFGDSRTEVVARMRAAMDNALDDLWPGRAEGLPFDDPMQALVLASIVERETGLAGERPRVAAVFINRLKRGMRLQSDPTVAYALSGGKGRLNRPLTRADLRVVSPYNTYTSDGLPPGPIANPGRAALEAVLHPANTSDLYFVADGKGGHAFARTLAEHNRNVARWRRSARKKAE